MVVEINGSIFNSKCIAIVNTVNCVGVMGKGLALAFKKIYYDNYLAYLDECKSKKLIPGKVFIYTNFRYQNHRYIINFPTKNHWKNNSKLEYITEGLIDLVKKIKELDIKSIAIPKLGCSNGHLEWSIVKPLIIEAFIELDDVRVKLYI